MHENYLSALCATMQDSETSLEVPPNEVDVSVNLVSHVTGRLQNRCLVVTVRAIGFVAFA